MIVFRLTKKYALELYVLPWVFGRKTNKSVNGIVHMKTEEAKSNYIAYTSLQNL